MSSFLKCFGARKRSDSLSKEKDGLNRKKKSKSKCKTKIDETDGKRFSKSIPINEENNFPSCCTKEKEMENGNGNGTYTATPYSPLTYCVDYGPDLPGISHMPVSQNNPFYNMNHRMRGKAVIFNFDRWDNTNIPDLALPPRLGSDKDKRDLAKCLRGLDFEVEEHDNKGNLEMWDVLEQLRHEDHSDKDCLVVGIMTHGEKNTVFVRDGTQIPVNLIWENFEAHRCPTLAGKPKIFIVQACRGKQYDSGTTLLSNQRIEAETSRSDVTDSATFSYVIPNAADIIVAFSCPLGHYSWRNPEKGSWFIQAICKVFEQYAYKMDLQTLFTTVAREVALNYASNTTSIESNNKRQVTSTSSTLIRTVCFKPKCQAPTNSQLQVQLDEIERDEEVIQIQVQPDSNLERENL